MTEERPGGLPPVPTTPPASNLAPGAHPPPAPPGDWAPPSAPPGPQPDRPDQRDGQWYAPSPDLFKVRMVQLLAALVAALIVVGGILTVAVNGAAGGIGAIAVIVVTAGVAVTLRRRVRAWGYAERHDDLLVRRGVLFRRQSVIPYGRMQFVDLSAGPFERMFGLSTVRMHTAAAASDARIPGLPADEAARLRDQLTVLGEAQAAGL